MSWWAVGAAVASAVVSQYNAAQTEKKRGRAVAESIATQRKYQDEANARMSKQLAELETSTPDDEKAALQGDIRKQLRQKQAMALAGLQGGGVGSDDAEAYAQQAMPVATGYGDFINEQVSGMDAPLYQRQGEAFERADVGALNDFMRRNSAQEDNLLRLRMAGIRDNPWLSMLSQGLSAYSGAKGFGGGNTMSGGVSGATTNPMISATSSQTLPGMVPDYSSIYGQPGKYGMFKW